MLSEWTIRNFKSFNGTTTIPLAPITILAGANSSGKSTIIQSILLVKQTLQYAPNSRPIGLNGPLLKLGRFDDVKNTESKTSDFSIGWTISDLQSYKFTANGLPNRYIRYSGDEYPSRATMHLSFTVSNSEAGQESRSSSTAELLQLQPMLDQLSLTVETSQDNNNSARSVHISLKKKTDQEIQNIGSIDKFYADNFPYYVQEITPLAKGVITERRPNTSIIGVNLRYFFPFRFSYTYDQRLYFSQKLSEYISTMNIHLRYSEPELAEQTLSSEVVNIILDHLIGFPAPQNESLLNFVQESSTGNFMQQYRGQEMAARDLVAKLEEATRNLRTRHMLRTFLIERQEELQNALFAQAQNLPSEGADIGMSHDFSAASEYMQSFFQSGIYYLGPLRDEPRPVYPLEALINPKDVGYRGEHTAAVLDLHRDTYVEYFKSSDAHKLIGATTTTSTLLRSVQDWLSYLGVAEVVSTKDLGKIGHQLQVGIDKNKSTHDLTNVGVGVSQLLPIVVMSLLANSPCLLIFEQPELHLHPKVQARLADFFFSLCLLGKQCILETHSEYLVERFRLRIAEAPGEELNKNVKIYFTQKVANKTTCKEVKLTKFGAITDWPDDFFDQSETETEAIIRAAQAKRKNEIKGDISK